MSGIFLSATIFLYNIRAINIAPWFYADEGLRDGSGSPQRSEDYKRTARTNAE